jgi:hypothetical protein
MVDYRAIVDVRIAVAGTRVLIWNIIGVIRSIAQLSADRDVTIVYIRSARLAVDVLAQRLYRARGEKAPDDEPRDNATGDGGIVLRQRGVRCHRATANGQRYR